jgi:AAA+ ATPase superfamily predicted ATPase
MLYTKTYKGKFRTKNPSKYKGDVGNIVYRSLWELRFMKWCDQNISVQEWGSETVIVPYISPLDKKVHRYFVDFYIKIKDKNGGIQKYLVEIKPERFTKPPSIPERKTKKFIDEVFQYGVNEAKWKAAFEFCQDRNMKFMVLTEKDLGLINGG